MVNRYIPSHDEMLGQRDLEICKRAFAQVLAQLHLMDNADEAKRLAAIIVTLYEQGVHNEHHLAMLASGWPLLANPFMVKHLPLLPHRQKSKTARH
ncbi:hypothetical protein [Rhizobium sp. BR 362]|uniref:hypothetical protein n=1 Tax=Rhizobium sp. BR 362 TaxID=3040670 RepID=UPI002F3EC164